MPRPGSRPRSHHPRHRGRDEHGGHVGLEEAREAHGCDRRRLRPHLRGHPALRRHEPSGPSSPRPRRAGRPRQFEHVGGRCAGLHKHAVPVAARLDRRQERLLPPVRRRLLGRPGHPSERHRPDRGDPGSRRDAVGGERRERRHQHHHQERASHAGDVRIDPRRKRGTVRGDRPVWRQDAGRRGVPDVRQILRS